MLDSEQKTYTGTAYNTYTFAYSYNLDGSLASQTYPSGRVVDFTYDTAGRPYTVKEAGGGGDAYLNSVAYAAHGGIDNLQLGNLLVEQTCYNDLLQPVARRLGDATSSGCAVQPTTDLLHLNFGYGAATTNNGNMAQQTIWAPDNGSGAAWQVTQDYTYDQVNRLTTAAEKLSGVTQWSRTYSYDHFGNRWISGHTGHTLHFATPNAQSDIDAATNRLSAAGTSAQYDNAGNLTYHPHITPGGSMTYDANNKMTAFAATGVSVSTVYGAADRRVRKVHNSKTTVWVYDAFGKLAAEYTMEAHADVGTYFRTTDHLGSTRLTTDGIGDVVARRDYFPFGERVDSNLSGRGSVLDGTLVSFNSSPGMRQQFTGQQRDDETGLDYFWARKQHPALGRFLSVDPGNAGAKLDFPGTWSAYGYVVNNPLRFADPDGRQCVELTDDEAYYGAEWGSSTCHDDIYDFVTDDEGNRINTGSGLGSTGTGELGAAEAQYEAEVTVSTFVSWMDRQLSEIEDIDNLSQEQWNQLVQQGAQFAAVGHHFLPRAIFESLQTTNPELYKLFNTWTSGPTNPPHGGFSRFHRWYNAHVAKITQKFVTNLGKQSLSQLTRAEGIQLMRVVASDLGAQLFNSTITTTAGRLGSRVAKSFLRTARGFSVVVSPTLFDVCQNGMSGSCDSTYH